MLLLILQNWLIPAKLSTNRIDMVVLVPQHNWIIKLGTWAIPRERPSLPAQVIIHSISMCGRTLHRLAALRGVRVSMRGCCRGVTRGRQTTRLSTPVTVTPDSTAVNRVG